MNHGRIRAGDSLRGMDQLLHPINPAEFCSRNLGREALRVTGTGDKFESLLSWSEVNAVLESHRLGPPRLRLACETASADELEFTDTEVTRRGEIVRRISRERLLSRLKTGHTLVFDAAEEVFPRLRTLAEDVGGFFGTHVQTNLYASWGSREGFGIHWDDHDVFVLQVSGRKHWRIFAPTREFPLYRDIEPPTRPDTAPTHDFILEQGDVLYVPRGHWHEVQGLDEPSLHLTMGVSHKTGIDIMSWLADGLRELPFFRQDVPRYGTAAEKLKFATRFREAILARIDDDIVAEYLDHHDGSLRARTRLQLPALDAPRLNASTVLRYIAPSSPRLSDDHANLIFHAGGHRWTVSNKAKPALERLLTRLPVSFDDLCQACPKTSPPALESLLRQLIERELLEVVT